MHRHEQPAAEASDNGINRGTYGCVLKLLGNLDLFRWLAGAFITSIQCFEHSVPVLYSFMWWSTRLFLRSCDVYCGVVSVVVSGADDLDRRRWNLISTGLGFHSFSLVRLAWAATYEPSESHLLQMHISSSRDRGISCGLVLDTMQGLR